VVPYEPVTVRPRAVRPRPLARLAVAGFVAGIGLLNLADAAWAHAVGIVCLLCSIAAAFLVIVPDALAD
jgi:hypothetical protein